MTMYSSSVTWATGLIHPAFIAVTKILLYSAGQFLLISKLARLVTTKPLLIVKCGSPGRKDLTLERVTVKLPLAGVPFIKTTP